MRPLRLGWAEEDARARAFEATLTEAELSQLARLPRALRAKLFERMGLPPPEGDRRGKHWAALREARRYEVRGLVGGPQLRTLEEAAALAGVSPSYLGDQFSRLRGTVREVTVEGLEGVTVREVDPSAKRPPGRPRRRARRSR